MLPLNFRQSGRDNIWRYVFFAIGFIYFLNCFTPLRLHVDTLRYFAIKDCIEFGCPANSFAAKDYLPYGYTALLLGLSKLGILRSFSIVFINGIYLFIGLYFVKKIFIQSIRPFFYFVIVLLNWTIIKFFTHPLSEIQYLFFSMGTLYFFYKYVNERKIRMLLLALLFAGMAFLTRTVGVALVAALLCGLIWEHRQILLNLIKKNKVIIILLLLILAGVIIFSRQLGLNHYTGVFKKQFKEGVSIGEMLKWHFTELAEVFVNLPANKIDRFMPGIGTKIFIGIGILFAIFFIWILFFRKNNVPFVVKSYLFFYFLIMFDWPFYDPRFWVPVLPLLAAIILQLPLLKQKGIKLLSIIYFCVYALFGLAAISYSTYNTFNKESFARTQANGVYRNEYETIFFGKPQSDTATYINQQALSVLKRYN